MIIDVLATRNATLEAPHKPNIYRPFTYEKFKEKIEKYLVPHKKHHIYETEMEVLRKQTGKTVKEQVKDPNILSEDSDSDEVIEPKYTHKAKSASGQKSCAQGEPVKAFVEEAAVRSGSKAKLHVSEESSEPALFNFDEMLKKSENLRVPSPTMPSS